MELPAALWEGPGKVAFTLVLAVVLAGLGLGIGSGLVRAAAFGLREAGVAITPARAILLSTVLLQGVAFGGVSLVYLRVRNLSVREWVGVSIPDLRGWLTVVSGWILAFLGAMTMVFVVVLTGLDPAANQTSQLGTADPLVFALLVPISFLLIGPGEELLFRGVIQNAMVENLGRVPGILLATLLFAAAHVFSLTGPLTGRATTVFLLMVPGLVLAVTYDYTKNIVVPSLVHGAYNATLFALAFFGTVFGG
ncbi:CPBP family intramembrane metalloprotease [Salinirubellus salinus]|uniref:CPBP family intramembrane metalloprotease n=1 Tax=Salinirubellus salinus TaxID=1364945 RepID=A0A9E7R4T9_9EURY|nr:CPBP family intramembrane glutamic endopeptidase [Salinirubellus salinus]UWM55496.1 CPBP family intramembrane metalloprotease [Salinirubellus salinus]